MENTGTKTTRYRRTAQWLVRVANQATSPDSRSAILTTAALYQKLADHADNWREFLKDRAA
jgi:hypothetical protein